MELKTGDNNDVGESKIIDPPPEDPKPLIEPLPRVDNPPVEESTPPKPDGIY